MLKILKYKSAVSNQIVLFAIAILFFQLNLNAQEQKDLKGEEIRIRGEFVPEVRESFKVTETPTIVDSTEKIKNITYSEIDKSVDTKFEAEPLPPAKMKGEPLTKLTKAYLKVGFGNYRTPMAELHINTLRSRQYTAGVSLKHWSTAGYVKDLPTSAFSDNEVKVFGKYFLADHTIGGAIDYNYNSMNYFGVNDPLAFSLIENPELKQNYNFVQGNVNLLSRYKEIYKLQYHADMKYYHLQSRDKASENNITGLVDFTKRYGSEIYAINTKSEFFFNKNSFEDYQNYIVKINPEVRLENSDDWNLRAGLDLVISGVQDQVADIDFFPNVKFSYNLVKEILIPYGVLSGGIDRNSLRSTMLQNPFINTALPLENTKRNFDIVAGVRGSMSKNISYNLGANFQKITNAALFVNDTTGNNVFQNKFSLIYDNMEVINGFAELGMEIGEKFNLMTRLDYYNYSMENQPHAWYLPEIKANITAGYNLKNKIIAKTSLFYIGDRKGFDHFQDNDITTSGVYPVTLRGFFDANLNFEYRYTSKFSLFLNINNVASARYNMWYNYPAQGINGIIGVSIRL